MRRPKAESRKQEGKQKRFLPFAFCLLLSTSLPPGPGVPILLEACVQCHDLDAISTQRKSEAGWRRTVNEMIWRGAPMMPGEADVLTKYLAMAFSAEQTHRSASSKLAPAPQNDKLAKYLPPEPGRALVLGACVQCHDLTITVVQRKTLEGWRRSVDQMAHLGAKLNGREIQLVAEYLARAFGPDDPIPQELRKPFTFRVNLPKGKNP